MHKDERGNIIGNGEDSAVEILKDHKIKYEIVPGITSGIGSATYAGIGFTLSYIDAQKDGTNGALLNKDREYVTLSAKKVF